MHQLPAEVRQRPSASGFSAHATVNSILPTVPLAPQFLCFVLASLLLKPACEPSANVLSGAPQPKEAVTGHRELGC